MHGAQRRQHPTGGRAIRRMAASLALAGALAVTMAGTTFASVTLTNGAFASTSINCSASQYWETETVAMRPAYGLASQTVAFIEYIQQVDRYGNSIGTGFWTSWRYNVAPFVRDYTTPMAGATFKVFMQYAWLRNGAWTYAGEWITSYGQSLGFGTTTRAYCDV